MRDIGYGQGLRLRPRDRGGLLRTELLPDGMARQEFYAPVDRGFEREIKKRLDYWAKLRARRDDG